MWPLLSESPTATFVQGLPPGQLQQPPKTNLQVSTPTLSIPSMPATERLRGTCQRPLQLPFQRRQVSRRSLQTSHSHGLLPSLTSR